MVQINDYDYRYDFKITENNEDIIVETHGIQHYDENTSFKQSLKEVQENDIQKEKLAKQNGVEHYIALDCRKSELEWIKKSVMESELPTLFNFKEDDIDWLKCEEFACNSLVREVCDLYNLDKNILTISNELKIESSTIRKYLKQGEQLGLCCYDPKEIIAKKSKKAYCLELDKVFDSVAKAEKLFNIVGSIRQCCKGNTKTACGYHWMFYEDYLNLNKL
jgi:uncharacterized protein YaeQ